MVNSIAFRNYQKSDYLSVKELLQKANMFAEPWELEENLDGMIQKDEESIIVGVDTKTNQVIANAFLVPYGSKVILVFRLVIKEDYRKQGIGTKLLEYICEVAKKKGVKEIGLFVDVKKSYLQEFYRKSGFILFPDAVTYMYKELK